MDRRKYDVRNLKNTATKTRATGWKWLVFRLWPVLLALGLALPSPSQAQSEELECLDDQQQNVELKNSQVLEWVKSDRPDMEHRVRVAGIVTAIRENYKSHAYFTIQIGTADSARIDLVYNLRFGDLHSLNVGDDIEACGYFSKYDSKSFIHWLHIRGQKKKYADRPDGWLRIGSEVFGNELPVIRPELQVRPGSCFSRSEKGVVGNPNLDKGKWYPFNSVHGFIQQGNFIFKVRRDGKIMKSPTGNGAYASFEDFFLRELKITTPGECLQ